MTTWTIRKRFTFAASHQLDHLPAGHQCARLHGHNYAITLELRGSRLDDAGMLVDFADMAPFCHYLDGVLDHRHLNDVIDVNPTAERLAAHLLDLAARLWPALAWAVEVQETETSWARAQR